MVTAGRALVLGGGGGTRIPRGTGLLAGLAEAGVDLTSADLVVGTSAGSVVGAQILSGVSVQDLYAEQLTEPRAERAAKMGATITLRFAATLVWPGGEERARARLGRAALKARTVPESERKRSSSSDCRRTRGRSAACSSRRATRRRESCGFSIATAEFLCSRRWPPAAPSPSYGHPSPSTATPTSTEGSPPFRTRTLPPDAIAWSWWPRSPSRCARAAASKTSWPRLDRASGRW